MNRAEHSVVLSERCERREAAILHAYVRVHVVP
jgi:hypothetical protein